VDRAAIKTLIQAAGYGADTQSVTAQEQAISAVLLELAAERQWSWLHKTSTGVLVVGDEEVPLPADFAYPLKVSLADSVTGGYDPLQELDADHVTHYLHIDDGTDLPDRWAFHQRTVVLYPRPDRAYTYVLEYIKEPTATDFDTDGESPDFPNQFHPLMAWGAMRWLATRQRDWSAKAAYDAEYERAKLNFSQADRRGDPDRVVHWPGWGY
jgi:hypothetical protein